LLNTTNHDARLARKIRHAKKCFLKNRMIAGIKIYIRVTEGIKALMIEFRPKLKKISENKNFDLTCRIQSRV
jgi:hypothetical protein